MFPNRFNLFSRFSASDVLSVVGGAGGRSTAAVAAALSFVPAVAAAAVSLFPDVPLVSEATGAVTGIVLDDATPDVSVVAAVAVGAVLVLLAPSPLPL